MADFEIETLDRKKQASNFKMSSFAQDNHFRRLSYSEIQSSSNFTSCYFISDRTGVLGGNLMHVRSLPRLKRSL